MIERLCSVDVTYVVRWIPPFEFWPQQSPGVPAMVNDLDWCGFRKQTQALVDEVMERQLLGHASNRMLSAVLPGAEIEPHVDPVPPRWVTRVHVPLIGDAGAVFELGGKEHHLEPGFAYSVDIRQTHSVRNRGAIPRIHLMWDVLSR